MLPGGDKPSEGFKGVVSARERDPVSGNTWEGCDDGTCSKAEIRWSLPGASPQPLRCSKLRWYHQPGMRSMLIPFNARSQTPTAALQLLLAEDTEQQYLHMLSNHLRKKMNDSASKMLEEKHESEDSGMSSGC